MPVSAMTYPALKALTDKLGDFDLIVAAAGFEDRTLGLTTTLPPRPHVGRVFLLIYRGWQRGNKVAEVVSSYRKHGIVIKRDDEVRYDRLYPDKFADSLHRRLQLSQASRVLLDITSMSRMAIMLCLDVICEHDLDLTIFYAEAERYGPSLEEYELAKTMGLHRPSVQVYSGVHGVTRAGRLSSVALQGEPSACIAFMSMNEKLTQAIITALSPSRLFLINGRPPRHQWREEATAWIHEQLRREWPAEDNPITFDAKGHSLPLRATSTLDYRQTVDVLLDLYWQLAAEYRLILAPTGSKMQTVGCYISKAINQDIHIEYPTPEGFLPEYTSGIGECWTVPFGRFGSFIDALRNKTMREHLFISYA